MRTAAALLAILLASPAAASCKASEFKIVQADLSHMIASTYRLLGEVANGCAEAATIQLQATLRNKAGKVVGVDEFSPSKGRLIAAGGKAPFEHLLTATGTADTLDLVIVEVRQP